jgi:dienelactone hydrolase
LYLTFEKGSAINMSQYGIKGFVSLFAITLANMFFACNASEDILTVPVFKIGPYPVGTSDVRIAEEFSRLSGEEMDRYLIGSQIDGEMLFIDDILANKENSLLLDIDIPQNKKVYGSAAGIKLPIFIHVTYPTTANNKRGHYNFPYARTTDNRFDHVQSKELNPLFADENTRYPLVFDSHGYTSHGYWGPSGSTKLSSHGYIVVSVNYGDNRISGDWNKHLHENFRVYAAQEALDFLLAHPDYKDHIDTNRIVATGHSLGGFTSLALAGGRYNGVGNIIKEPRVSAVIPSGPWTGGILQDGSLSMPFGKDYVGLRDISVPMLGLYGTKDEATKPEYVIPALAKTTGPRYIIALVDQPHVYESGSWQDQANWVLLFLEAYFKDDEASLELLKGASSVENGNIDLQRFDLQQ